MQVPSEPGQYGNLNDAVKHARMLIREGIEVRKAFGMASKQYGVDYKEINRAISSLGGKAKKKKKDSIKPARWWNETDQD